MIKEKKYILLLFILFYKQKMSKKYNNLNILLKLVLLYILHVQIMVCAPSMLQVTSYTTSNYICIGTLEDVAVYRGGRVIWFTSDDTKVFFRADTLYSRRRRWW